MHSIRPLPPITFLAALLVAVSTSAFGARADQVDDASEFIRILGEETVATLGAEEIPKEKRLAKYQALVEDSFAMKTIGRFVLGRNWRIATPEQQTEYLELFRTFVIDAYASKLDAFPGTQFSVLGAKALDEKDTIVSTRVQAPDYPPVLIDYRVRTRNSKHLIIDVIVEGVSLVTTQRSEFASVVERNGIEGLLELLRKRRATSPIPNGAAE